MTENEKIQEAYAKEYGSRNCGIGPLKEYDPARSLVRPGTDYNTLGRRIIVACQHARQDLKRDRAISQMQVKV